MSPCGFRDILCRGLSSLKIVEPDSSIILPHSHEQATAHDTYAENAVFQDYSPGTNLIVESSFDEAHEETVKNNLPLQKFFNRPVLIQHYEWQVNTLPAVPPVNPWLSYFRNKRVANRIANYKLLRCKLHIRVLINGSPMHYGRMLLTYNPLFERDEMQTNSTSPTLGDLIGISQRPHLWLNPTTCQGGDMELPFLWPANALDIVTEEYVSMGLINMYPITFLRHANGGTTDVQISIYAWASDVVLSSPTHGEAETILPQSDEYGDKAFSAKASNIASMVGKLSHAPMIGPYARATSMAMSLASNIASLFGFSKPVELNRTIVSMQTTGPLSTSNTVDNSVKLSLDSKQELTIDPRAFGLSTSDEMEILHIASTESYLTDFVWDPGNSQPAGTILWNSVVDPLLFNSTAVAPPDIPEVNLTAMAFAALPFEFWRGSIIYRFQVVCSAMHKGRLRVVYDPEGEVSFLDPTSITPEYNLGYNLVVDISETKDFEVSVGWSQATSYREHASLDTPPVDLFDINPVPYRSSEQRFGNGVLGVYIVNELVSPSASADSVSVIVSVRAGPDFEVGVPTSKFLNRLRYRTISNVNAPEALIAEATEDIQPQSSEISSPIGAIAGGEATNPISPAETVVLSDKSSLVSHTNSIYFGETIRSFRTLLKRYSLNEYMVAPNGEAGTIRMIRFYRTAMPQEPGFAAKADAANSVPVIISTKPYVYGYLTPLRYLTSGFVAWRGSIRWKVGAPACCNSMLGPQTVSRSLGCTPENYTTSFGAAAQTSTTRRNMIADYDEMSGPEGVLIEYNTRNPVASFEVPFYSRYRFAFGRSLTNFRDSPDSEYYPCWKYGLTLDGNLTNQIFSFPTYCAAGEDFNLGMFIGAPAMYLEPIPPS